MGKITTKDSDYGVYAGQVVRVTAGTGKAEGKAAKVTIVSSEYNPEQKKEKKVYRDFTLWNNDDSDVADRLLQINPAEGSYIMVYGKPSEEEGEGNPQYTGYKFQAYNGKIAVLPEGKKRYTAVMGRLISASEGVTSKGNPRLTITVSGGKDQLYVMSVFNNKYATDAIEKAKKAIVTNKSHALVQGDDGKYRPGAYAPVILFRGNDEAQEVAEGVEGYFVNKFTILGYQSKSDNSESAQVQNETNPAPATTTAEDDFVPVDESVGGIPFFEEDLGFMNA